MTQEQLDRYEQDLAAHKKFIENYRFFLDRICTHLEWQGGRLNKTSWTPAEIKDWIGSEISASSSLDEPNRPGYYRANND